MHNPIPGVIAVLGRLLLTSIFLMSAIANKIPKFNEVAGIMENEGIRWPKIMLAGAIVFLIVGSLSVIVGYKARIGALLLLVFLALATYYFHDFWTIEDAARKELEMGHFMSNSALMGAMLLIIAGGSGPMSLDSRKPPGS